ncbi:hypothetical protein R69619_02735 [Paraburkholderia nemoris]|uniref:hypothetical protein n=1 Tax=Paraburkholderia nemoris TaxID=2793076 RepID=UPI00190CF874|nr:hypothetical protein [Paraburkholderia nemoris]MBK3741183.1 hypothetical protein [Paraburkholderia aspalathi]CAE6746775.1 hypothetical protein R69619_02735 [Paraburkholderia nemoris]
MSKQSNTVGNVAIGLAVVVLGFVVYKTMFSGNVTYTGAAPTAKQTSTAANPAALAASLVPTVNSLSSLFGSLNSYVPAAGTSTLGGLDQTYTSAAYNPDAISSAISSDTTASMASAGESDLNSWGFSL